MSGIRCRVGITRVTTWMPKPLRKLCNRTKFPPAQNRRATKPDFLASSQVLKIEFRNRKRAVNAANRHSRFGYYPTGKRKLNLQASARNPDRVQRLFPRASLMA
jgi:hypothetical protein